MHDGSFGVAVAAGFSSRSQSRRMNATKVRRTKITVMVNLPSALYKDSRRATSGHNRQLTEKNQVVSFLGSRAGIFTVEFCCSIFPD
jgi:hypothetical protein